MNSFISNSEQSDQDKERKDARRFLLRYLLPFVAGIALFCVLFDVFMREAIIFETPILGAAKIHRAFDAPEHEIPIIGSSRALGSYIPDSIHPDAYNYGINGIGYEVMDVFVRKMLEQQNARSPIILNWDYEMFIKSGGDVTNYIALAHLPEIRGLMKRIDIYSPIYAVYGLRFFDGFDVYMREFLNERIQLTKLVTDGAAIEKNPVTKAEFDGLVKKRYVEHGNWDPVRPQIDTLLKRIGQRPDREWYVVVAPYHASYYESFPKDGMAEARSILARIDAMPNARVIDIDGRTWPDSLFVNTSHINLEGAIRFSREVREAIAAVPGKFMP